MKKIITLFACSGFALFFTHTSIFAQDGNTTSNESTKSSTATSPTTTHQKIGDWDIRCVYPDKNKTEHQNIKQKCEARQNLMVTDKTTQKSVPVAAITLEQTAKQSGKTAPTQFSFVTPAGFALTQPVELTVNQQKISLPWKVCNGNQCIASTDMTNTFKQSLANGDVIHFIIHRINGTTLTINFKVNNIKDVLSKMDELSNKTN